MPRIWRWTIGRAPEARTEGGSSSAAAEGGLPGLARPGLSAPPEESSAADIQSGRAFFAGVAQRLNDAAGASTLGKDGGLRATATFLSGAMDLSDRVSRPVGSVGDFTVGRLPGESESFIGSLPSLMSYADPSAMARGDVVDSPFGTREDAGGPDLVDRALQRSPAPEKATAGPADVEVVPGESTFQRLNRLVEAGKARLAAEKAGGPRAARPDTTPPVPRSVPRRAPETRQPPTLARPVRRLADSVSYEGAERAPTPAAVPRSVPVARNEAGAAAPAPTPAAASEARSAAPAPGGPAAPAETFIGRRPAPETSTAGASAQGVAPAVDPPGPTQLPTAVVAEPTPAGLPPAAPVDLRLPLPVPRAVSEGAGTSRAADSASDLALAKQPGVEPAGPADAPDTGAPGGTPPLVARSVAPESSVAASPPAPTASEASTPGTNPVAPAHPTAASTTGPAGPLTVQRDQPAGAERAPGPAGVVSRLADSRAPTAPSLPLAPGTATGGVNESGAPPDARLATAPPQRGADDAAGLPLAQRTPAADTEFSRLAGAPERGTPAADTPGGPGLLQAKADPDGMPNLPTALPEPRASPEAEGAAGEVRPQASIARATSDEGIAAPPELPLAASAQRLSSETAQAAAAAGQGSSAAASAVVNRIAEPSAAPAVAGESEPGPGSPPPPPSPAPGLPISRETDGGTNSAPGGATMARTPQLPGRPEGEPGLPLPIQRSTVQSQEAQLPGGEPATRPPGPGPAPETRTGPLSISRAADEPAAGTAGLAPVLPTPPAGEARRTAEGDLQLASTPGFGKPSSIDSPETRTPPHSISRSADDSSTGGPGPVIPLPQAGEAGREPGRDLPLASRAGLEQPTPEPHPATQASAHDISRTPDDSGDGRPVSAPFLAHDGGASPAARIELPMASTPGLGQPDTVSEPGSRTLGQSISRVADDSGPGGPSPVAPLPPQPEASRATGGELPLAEAQGGVSRTLDVEPDARQLAGDIPGVSPGSAAGAAGTTPLQSPTSNVAGVQRATGEPTAGLPLRAAESPMTATRGPSSSDTDTLDTVIGRPAASPRAETGEIPRSGASAQAPSAPAPLPLAQRAVDHRQGAPQITAVGAEAAIGVMAPGLQRATTRPWADAPSLPLPALEPFEQPGAEETARGRSPGSEALPAPLLGRSTENAGARRAAQSPGRVDRRAGEPLAPVPGPARPSPQTTVGTARATAVVQRPAPDRPWARRLVSRLTGGGGTSPLARESSADAPGDAPAMAEPAESAFPLPGRTPGQASFAGDSGPADAYAPGRSPVSVSRVSRAVSAPVAAGSAPATVSAALRPLAFGPGTPRVTAQPEQWTPPATPGPLRTEYTMTPPAPLPLAASSLVSRQVDVQPVHHEAVAQVRRAVSEEESSISNAPAEGEAGANVDELAEKVWQKLRRRLTIERERKHGRS